MENGFLVARDLVRVYGSGQNQVVAVDHVDLDIAEGELGAIVGRSGSGKTTLINLLSGLDRPTSGAVLFRGQEVSRMPERELVELRRHHFAFIFQSFALLPLLSAYENVELPLRIQGVPWGERRTLVREALEAVGLGHRMHHRPYELSGGEQQRVAIARALVTSPQVIFADEPTGELDSANAMAIGRLLRSVVDDQGITLVMVTHDLALASLADRVVELVDGHIARETTGVR